MIQIDYSLSLTEDAVLNLKVDPFAGRDDLRKVNLDSLFTNSDSDLVIVSDSTNESAFYGSVDQTMKHYCEFLADKPSAGYRVITGQDEELRIKTVGEFTPLDLIAIGAQIRRETVSEDMVDVLLTVSYECPVLESHLVRLARKIGMPLASRMLLDSSPVQLNWVTTVDLIPVLLRPTALDYDMFVVAIH